MADDKNTTATPATGSNDKKVTPATGSPEPSKSDREKIAEAYRKATPKERAKKFKVDPVTKTLRRA